MKKEYTDKEVEFALQLICHPEQVDDAEAELWLEDANHQALLEELRRYREAGFVEEGEVHPNVEKQWEVFSMKHETPRRNIHLGWLGSVAAAVAVLLVTVVSIYSNWGEKRGESFRMPLAQQEASRAVTVITGEGEKVLLDSGLLQLNKIAKVENVLTNSPGGASYLNVQSDSAMKREHHTIRVPRGMEYFVELGDGSRVWLNSETELRYPVAFDDGRREVELLKGEAYFEVSRDEKRPFVVISKEVTTRVLGTEFNVQSYTPERVNVTLVKGSVIVKENKIGAKEVILQPGENASLVDHQLVVEQVDVLKYTAWKDGYFYYDNVRLEEILDELGRWFNFSVFYQNELAKDYRFKLWAGRKESPEKLVERLNETGKLNVQWKDGSVIVSDK